MKQLLLGAALVGIGTIIGAFPQTTPTPQPTLNLLHRAVNQAMLCGTYPSLAKAGGSYMPIAGEYGRVTWTR